jgi:hypothetical protein
MQPRRETDCESYEECLFSDVFEKNPIACKGCEYFKLKDFFYYPSARNDVLQTETTINRKKGSFPDFD